MATRTAELQLETTRRWVHPLWRQTGRANIPDESQMTDDEIRQMIREAQAHADAGYVYTTEEVRQSLERRLGYEIRG